jgi:hypothetical protein
MFIDRHGNSRWIDAIVKEIHGNGNETFDIKVLHPDAHKVNPLAVFVPRNKLRAKSKPTGVKKCFLFCFEV